ncbi:MAG: arsenate reductase [Boseongicola sp. SB0662_bin_57]|nr:arsenate reductase [Boseongicola sp. SB0662_bin_57]
MTGSGMPTLYGLKNCSTCRTAAQELKGAGKDVTFVDVRESRLAPDVIDRFLQEFGDALVNRRSTTWRNLSDRQRQGSPDDLIARHPSLMKRPVIVEGEMSTLGWNAAARARHLGE